MAEEPAKNAIVLATGNPHKVEELRAIMGKAGLGVPILGLSELPGHPFAEPRETGTTFEQNATIKALAYAEATGRWCLADDSGLEIDALDGRPGVISSHYCTDGREEGMDRPTRDRLNNERVLRELEGVPAEKRTARFVCVMVLARPSGASASPMSGGRDPRPTNSPRWGAGVPPARGRPATFEGKQDWSFTGDLPHFQVGGATYFVTFRCLKPPLTPAERQIVCDALLFWHGERLMMHVATVMPDHVHMLFRPIRQTNGEWPTLDGILHSIKSFTSHKIATLRGETGTLWQSESFDRVMRDADELDQARAYIQENPVKAGLAAGARLYPFTVYGPNRQKLEARTSASPMLGGRDARPPSGEVLARARGTFEGRIGLPEGAGGGGVPRGGNGFGYDPLFLVGPEFAVSSAELSPEQKNTRSHRAAAAMRMAHQIVQLTTKLPSEKDPNW